MPMYNLTEYTNNQSKTYGSLWQYCRAKSAVYANGGNVESNKASITKYFDSKTKIVG